MFGRDSNDVEEMAGKNNNFGKADAKEVPNSIGNLPALNKSIKPKSEMLVVFFFFHGLIFRIHLFCRSPLLVLILSYNDAE